MSMDIDSSDSPSLLDSLAAGRGLSSEQWPSLRDEILQKLEEIVLHDFPIPKLPPPHIPPNQLQPPAAILRSSYPVSSSPKPDQLDNAQQEGAATTTTGEAQQPDTNGAESNEERTSSLPPAQSATTPQLPPQLNDMLVDIKTHLQTFPRYPPHTTQRLAELLLQPRRHYKALASYLHAVDRVVHVTSGTDTYPLPPTVAPLGGSSETNGNGSNPNGGQAVGAAAAAGVSWGNTVNSIGSDEALGGALLTPIPWLSTRSPEGGSSSASAAPVAATAGSAGPAATPAQIRSESTETIEGPNGAGSVETVSVCVNGVPSTGHSRGITQGELLRQEQKAGVVPVTQLPRSLDSNVAVTSTTLQAATGASNGDGPGSARAEGDGDEANGNDQGGALEEDAEEAPHVRGPEEIGMSDTGPQVRTTSHMGDDGISMQGIDVEAAVGRRKPEEEAREAADSIGSAVPAAEDDVADSHSETTTAPDAAAREADEEQPPLLSGEEGAGVDKGDADDTSDTESTTSKKREAEQRLEPEVAKKARESPQVEEQVKMDADKDGAAAAEASS